jgi:hypothetical protein
MLIAEHKTYPDSLAYHDNIIGRAGERHKGYVRRDGGVCGPGGLNKSLRGGGMDSRFRDAEKTPIFRTQVQPRKAEPKQA